METEQIRSVVLTTLALIAPDSDMRQIPRDRPLRQEIDLDSMDWLNVIAGLEESLSMEIPESDHERLTTLDVIVDYLASRQAGCLHNPSRSEAGTPSSLPTSQHLIDGKPVTVRPMRADDMELEADFVRHLSADNRYNRFMVTVKELPPRKLAYLTDVDQVRHVALVASMDTDGRQVLVGVVRYVVDARGTNCEFAIAIDDAWQGSGLAGILMHILMAVGRSRGLLTMEGLVLRTNTRMLKFTRQLGFTHQRDPEDRDTVRVVRSL